jgi:hypothetical protein
MAVPRPILLALLGTILLAATFMATRSSKAVSEKVANPAVQAQPKANAPAAPGKPAALSAQDAVRAVVSPGTPLNSARFRLRISAKELGGKHRSDSTRVDGSFAPGASGGPVNFDVTGRDAANTPAHVVSAAGKAYGFKGTDAFELPASPKRAAASRRTLGGANAAKLPSVDPAPWFKQLKSEPGPTLGGVATTHVSGVVNSKKMAKDLRSLVRAAGKSATQPTTLPHGFGAKLEKAFRGAHLDAYVGTQDKVLRRARLAGTITFPPELLARGTTPRWHTVLDLSLSGVNKPQAITPPAKAEAKGVSRREHRSADTDFLVSAVALDPPGGLAQLSAGYLRTVSVARARLIPRKVEAAVRAHKKVVIFFYQRNGVDDGATAASVLSLRKRTKALIFADSIDNLAAYGQVVQSVGVTRSPSIVIIGRKGRARLVDGYIDPSALAQEVSDTR